MPGLYFLTQSWFQSPWYLALASEGRQRLIFLDLGEGSRLLIAIASSDPARFDQLVADAMPIVESFTFK
jgi:hypothetical protein